jgi:hypothetical protein
MGFETGNIREKSRDKYGQISGKTKGDCIYGLAKAGPKKASELSILRFRF